MTLFSLLLGKILPLYANVAFGYLAARFLRLPRGLVASLLFYVLGPIVVFTAVMGVRINPAVASLPLFFFLLGSALAFVSLPIYRKNWADGTANILAFTSGTGNTGYFGIALALILLEPETADVFIFTVLASFCYESTTGFYITAKGAFSARESLFKVLRLPILYAFFAALLLNLSGAVLPEVLTRATVWLKIAYSILGMMVIGMGLKGMRQGGRIDRRFLLTSLAVKHIFWPLLIWGLIVADRSLTHLLDDDLHRVMFLFAIVPLAGNTVTLAVLLNARPDKAALAVLLSTVLSMFSIPLMLALYGN